MPFVSHASPESWQKHKQWKHFCIVETRHSQDLSQYVKYAGISIAVSGAWLSMYKPKPLEFALSTEVIIGWRAWKIVDFERRGNISERRLQALGTNPVWEPYQENVAICTTDGSHEAPWPTCHCGFWAFKEREHVERSLFETYGGEKGKVIGQIALWGRVLECSRGYRGEFAYPQTLQFVSVEKAVAKDIAERYGVPYSIIKPSDKLKCVGAVMSAEYDGDRFYVTLQYQCGLEVRSEVSRNWEGKGSFDPNECPPCPHHNP